MRLWPNCQVAKVASRSGACLLDLNSLARSCQKLRAKRHSLRQSLAGNWHKSGAQTATQSVTKWQRKCRGLSQLVADYLRLVGASQRRSQLAACGASTRLERLLFSGALSTSSGQLHLGRPSPVLVPVSDFYFHYSLACGLAFRSALGLQFQFKEDFKSLKSLARGGVSSSPALSWCFLSS